MVGPAGVVGAGVGGAAVSADALSAAVAARVGGGGGLFEVVWSAGRPWVRARRRRGGEGITDGSGRRCGGVGARGHPRGVGGGAVAGWPVMRTGTWWC